MSRTRPASSCSGLSTGIAAIVVQLGLAMMPLRASAIASGLTSLTTSGTSGSIRQAEELSMTIAPAAANRGASASRGRAAGGEERDVEPGGSAVAASSTVMSPSRHGSVVPAERAEAKKRMLGDREVALGEQPAHDRADLAGGADDPTASRALRSSAGPAVDGGLGLVGSRARTRCAPP